MNLADLWEEIEAEQKWRTDEMRFFQNIIANIKPDVKQDQYRRALVLLLYAHFEGFCKFAFTHYIKAVNHRRIKCHEANYAIAASTLSKIFASLRNPDKKCDIFRKTLPEDSQLHRFARDREFLERISEISSLDVSLDDNLIDTESNLKPEILQKILYRLGLPHSTFDNLNGQINKLLNCRNTIAHGEKRAGISKETYDSLKEDVFFIINEVKREIMKSLKNKSYLRSV